MDMKEIREKIDALDDTIKAAFEERMTLCADMAAYKKENDLPIFYPAREREIIARLTKDMDAGMATYTKVLYNTLFEVSRSYQTKRIYDGGKLSVGKVPQTVAAEDNTVGAGALDGLLHEVGATVGVGENEVGHVDLLCTILHLTV